MAISPTGFDMAAFAAQSEQKTIQTMQLNQRQADMANLKALHDSALKQQKDNNDSVANMAKAPSEEGKKASEAFSR